MPTTGIRPASLIAVSTGSNPGATHRRFAWLRGAPAPYRLPVYIACAVLAIACNYILGKDMAWDTLNYHLYAGFSALNDRFGQDYFPAGPPSYFNPLAYVPFYAMVSARLPALLIGSVLAAVHSVILWLTFELGISVCPANDDRARAMSGICAAFLAFMNPLLMQQIGSCFADITTAELALAGWVLLAGALREPGTARLVCAGLMLGAASALKMSNAMHAFAAFAVLIMLPLNLWDRIRHGLIYGISLGVGFVLVAAPWAYRLEKMFGNPLFPMLNNVFRSPEFITEAQQHSRFIPSTFAEALWRPFAMVDPVRMVHEELRAPDLRYAVLAALILGLFLRWLWRRRARPPGPATRAELAGSTRVLVALGCGFGVDWVLWMTGSGNSRYFLPMACVAAALVVGMLFRLFDTRPKVRNHILAAIFGVQAAQLSMAAEFRWNGVPWGGQWFDVAMPEKLRTEPNLYLTIGAQSNSFIAPFLARDSGLINFSGGYALGPEGANGARIYALIRRYSPHLRVLMLGAKLYEDAELRAPRRSQADDALERFGLRTDMNDCVTITLQGLPPDLEIRFKTSAPIEPQSRDTTYLLSCHVVADNTDRSALIARQRAVDLVFDRLEDACPKLFQPRRPVTEHDGATWRRLYTNTDLSAWISHGWVKFLNPISGNQTVFVGRERDWAKKPLRLDCGRRNDAYFAHVLN
jgi:hypothetical protein